MDDMLKRDLTRRSFLKRASALGFGAASLPLLATYANAAAQSPSPKPPLTPAPVGSMPPGARALEFNAWEFQPDTIRGFLNDWTATSGVPVNLSLIPNVGYGPAIQTRLQGGGVLDCYYNFCYNSGKFVDQGWARNLADLPGVNDMLGEMFEPARARHLLPDGRVVSVPYFSAAHVLHYNEKHLKDNGISVPTTLQEQYDAAKKLKAAGVASPYVAYWIKEFCEEYLMAYLLAEGITPFDDAGNPVFADDPKTQGMLEWWNAMFQDKLTTETMLTDDPIKLATLMGTGDASFYVLHHYFLRIIRELKDAASKDDVTISYRMPGAKGDTLQMGEVIQMGTQATGRTEGDAWDLMKFYGWKDNNGELRTFKAWAAAAALAAPYKAFFEDPEVAASYGDYYDMAALSDVFANKSEVVGARALPWYQPFQVKVGERIHAMLLGQASPADTVKGLADDAKSVQSGGL
ncbi:MAG: ABC transporter substrate-binding protein [Chloroflexota bacterium]